VPRFELLDGVSDLPREEWNALVGDESPFLEWDWLASLEQAGCVAPEHGWRASPLVVREQERLVAACPLYVKEHSEGEFVFDWAWADAAERAGIRYYPKLLAAVPFTPVTGARFLTAAQEDRALWTPQLAGALQKICSDWGLSGVHVNFCREDEAEGAPARDYLLRIGFQYHWRNHGYETFEDYLGRFRSKRRNQIRRERREMERQGITIEPISGDAVSDEIFDAMFACYEATVQAHSWGRQYLNRDFFELLRERFGQRLCFVVARRGREIVGGTTNVVKGDTFYGRYWGALEPLRHLHFNVCYYAPIEYCIQRGLACMEPGAGGDYKWLRGFEATPTRSLHFLAEPRLAQAVERFLESERREAARVIDELERASPIRGKSPAGSREQPG